MNRNRDTFFYQNPSVNIKRSKFDMSHDVKTTFNFGKLIPVDVIEVLPGDTFSVDLASLVRMSTPLYPVMDDAYLDVYFFFTPNRLVWDHWEDFITGGAEPENYNNPASYEIPTLGFESFVTTGDVADYLGVPSDFGLGDDTEINALPLRGYIKIWNDWFRDENLQASVLENTGDATVWYNTDEAYCGGACLPVNKYSDIFTRSLPAPQKGPDVIIPGFENFVVPNSSSTLSTVDGAYVYSSSDGSDFYGNGTPLGFEWDETGGNYSYPGVQDGWTAPTINALRLATQMQKYQETLGLYGSRYVEWLYGMFGVTDPLFAKITRPEYLGGKRIPINISQVVQQNYDETQDSPLGRLGAFSATRFNDFMFTKSFTEHGFIHCVVCARTKHTYSQGLAKWMNYRSYLDLYNPKFANIGNQAVMKSELYTTYAGSNDEVFGYQEAWYQYRYIPNKLSGQFRPYLNNSYKEWTYGDIFTGDSFNLNADFIKETTANVDRTLAVTSETDDQLIADLYFKVTAVRPMPVYSIPGLMDHN